MPRQIRLNAFDMNCIGHQSPGLWTHPDDRAESYNTLEYWTDLARTLERGKFDALFIADVLGIYDVYKGSGRTALEQAVQVPVNDPLMVVPPMAMVTEHLGFGITCALSYELPYPFARRMSTLDHLTKGRVGWNIVTGYLDSAARGMGMAKQVAHDDRYDVAEDYMQAVYKLWEASWEDGAVLRDRQGRRFADPDKIHRDSPRRTAFPGRRDPSVRAVAAAHAGAVSGRRLQAGPRLRRSPRRVRVHQRSVEEDSWRDRRRSAPSCRCRRPRSARPGDLHHDDGDHRQNARG